MTNIYKLLKLNQELLKNFALQGNLIENNVETDRVLRNATRKLKAIEDRMQDDGMRPNFNSQSVEEVINKVKRCKDTDIGNWEVKELRLISYYLAKLIDHQKYFNSALQLLDYHWKNLYLNGLMFFLMNSWNNCPDDLLLGVSTLIKSHLKKYCGPIRRYQILKLQSDFLDKVGPSRLAKLLQHRKMSLFEAPQILGYKSSALSYQYFSDVIINYYKQNRNINYSELEDVFNRHSLDRTKKLIFSYLVEEAEDSCDGNFQGAVVRSARRVLGDINVATTWSPFKGATQDEIWQLERAKDLVIAWGARKTVDAFFDICVQDSRRREFWEQYVNHIMDYRIIGSTSIKAKLQANPEVAPLLKTGFIETNSINSTTAALVLFIKDKVFVEFSDVGSLYIYNSTRHIISGIKRKRMISSTTALKEKNFGMAIDGQESWGYQCFEEGRITHIGYWENRVKIWLHTIMWVDPGKKTIYSDSKASTIENRKNRDTNKISTVSATSKSPVSSSKKDYVDSQWNQSFTYQPSLFPEEKGVQVFESNFTANSTNRLATEIKTEIRGIYSKWIFKDSCRIIANLSGIYVQIKRSNKTYFVSTSSLSTLKHRSIWIKGNDRLTNKLRVQLAEPNNVKDVTSMRTLGTIETSGSDIIYTPLNGDAIKIPVR